MAAVMEEVTAALTGRLAEPSAIEDLLAQREEIARQLIARGDGCLRENRYELALDAYTRAAVLAPNHAMAFYRLGVVHEMQGRAGAARAAYRRAGLLSLDELRSAILQGREVNPALVRRAIGTQPLNSGSTGKLRPEKPWSDELPTMVVGTGATGRLVA